MTKLNKKLYLLSILILSLTTSYLMVGFSTPIYAQGPPKPNSPALIYVSPSGSDITGNGSLVSPYATISHAVASASPGATIIIEPGVYNEMVNITKTVTLESMSSQPSNTIINAIGQVYGIEIIGPNANGTVIEGLTVEHADNHGIYVQDSSHVTIEDNVVSNNGLQPSKAIAENKAIELVGTDFSTVVANQVLNNIADGGIAVADIGVINPGGLTSGIPSPAIGNVISGNTVIGNIGGCGIVVAAYNPGEGVINNIVSNNYVANGLPGGIVIAADVPSTSAINNTVIGNTVLNNLIPGIIIHSNTPGDLVYGTKIINNVVSGNNGFGPKTTGITLIGQISSTATIVSNTIIAGNTIHNEYFGILALNATDTTVMPDNSFDPSVTVPVLGATIAQSSTATLASELNSLNGTVTSLSNTVNTLQSTSASQSSLNSLNSTVSGISSQLSTISYIAYSALIVAIVLGIIAIILSMRRRG